MYALVLMSIHRVSLEIDNFFRFFTAYGSSGYARREEIKRSKSFHDFSNPSMPPFFAPHFPAG
jgi:hypothetical protein